MLNLDIRGHGRLLIKLNKKHLRAFTSLHEFMNEMNIRGYFSPLRKSRERHADSRSDTGGDPQSRLPRCPALVTK